MKHIIEKLLKKLGIKRRTYKLALPTPNSFTITKEYVDNNAIVTFEDLKKIINKNA